MRQPQRTGNGEQHRRRRAGDAERRPDQEIAPFVLQQFEPVGDARKVGGLHIGGEIGRVIGQQAGVEDIALGDRRPFAVDQRMPGEPAHDGGGKNAIVGAGARGSVARGPSDRRGPGRIGVGLRVGRRDRRRRAARCARENLRDIAVQRAIGLGAVIEQAGRIDLVERHVMRVLAQLVDFVGREAAALEQHRRRRKIGRGDEERNRRYGRDRRRAPPPPWSYRASGPISAALPCSTASPTSTPPSFSARM